MPDPRYPISRLELKAPPTAEQRRRAIDRIAAVPAALRAAVRGLSDAQLDTSDRDGGWTARQVVHHVADSYINAYVRCKLTWTELDPPAKGDGENAWARQPDVKPPIEPTLRAVRDG